MNGAAPADWHPDPFGRHELRYWDGFQWTHHVSSRGSQGLDPPGVGPVVPTVSRTTKKGQREVRNAGVDTSAQVGGGTLLTEPVLVVNQKPKLIGVNAQFTVYDQHGNQVGAVREVGQNFVKSAVAARPVQNRTRKLQIVDLNGRVLMALTRPANIVRSKVIVRGADGIEIGQIAQKNIGFIGNIRFVLESGGKLVGSINAEGRDASDFSIQDAAGTEVARITKTWAGLLSMERSRQRDKYVVQMHRPLDDPLRSLVVAAALAVDTALKS